MRTRDRAQIRAPRGGDAVDVIRPEQIAHREGGNPLLVTDPV
jgi:hypothetical protein